VEENRQAFTIGGRLRSFQYAIRGIVELLRSQHNARIHALATICVVVFGFLLGVSALEWCALILAVVAVWSAEALNTALEFLCDVVSPEFHPLVAKAKDVSAAGVLLTAIGAAVVGLLVLGPHLLNLL